MARAGRAKKTNDAYAAPEKADFASEWERDAMAMDFAEADQ